MIRKHLSHAHLVSITIASSFALSIPASGQTYDEEFNPVQTAIISQTIAGDARAGSMGDIGVATDPDVFSQQWNPAKYPFCISKAGFSVSYTPWLRKLTSGISLTNAVGYVRLGDYQALSASIRYFNIGETMTDDEAITVKPYEFSVDVAYSRLLSEIFSAAVALRFMYSDLSGSYDDDVTPGSAFAADIAVYYNNYILIGSRECMLGLGLNISNIGSKINFGEDTSYFIPTTLRLGASLLMPINEYNRLSFNFEVSKLLVPERPLQEDAETDEAYQQRLYDDFYDVSSISGIFKSFSGNQFKKLLFGVGVEYAYNDKFFLRGGYHHEDDSQGGRKYFTFGAGFAMSVLAIDAGYAVATNSTNPLDGTLRVSLSFDMDGIRDLIGRR